MGNISVRVDDKLKRDSSKILDELGLDMTTGVRIFLKQVVMSKGLPFDVSLKQSGIESALNDIKTGNVETFNSVESLIADLNGD